MSSAPIPAPGWYESVPLDRVEWYNDTAPADQPPVAGLPHPRHPVAPDGVPPVAPSQPSRRLDSRLPSPLACVLVCGAALGAFALGQSASPVLLLAYVTCGLTAGWIASDLAKAYRESRRYR
ncbi:MAG: hypothetical protein QOH29_1291 [Actinomycetota bacterium]|nr:hypothetical protein [Actinomycetota bacterium]